MKSKIVGLFVCMLLLVTGITISGKLDIKEMSFDNDGTLSGYVNDTSMNPIEGALVRVHFHGTYEEDYTDSLGYFHVINIPICWCMKNSTASKPGYKGEWIYLAIEENTTHDFVLSRSNVLYVGGSGPGNYSKIQDAIDNASDQDTVFVYDDLSPYNESIKIDKSINLVGENKTTTVIEGYDGIEVSADLVTINGFTVMYVVSIDSCFNVTISDNIINSGSWNAVELKYSHNNKISDNEILNGVHGIELFYSNKNIISGNVISNNYSVGIMLFAKSNKNMIKGNGISNCFFGIFASSRGNIIENNNFIENRVNAIFSYFWRDILDSNYWNSNYWDRHNGDGPKIIFGTIGFLGVIPWINFDKNPAKEPYVVGV